MTRRPRTIAVHLQRAIPASPSEVYDAWLDPQTPGSPWHEVHTLILDPKVDGLFYRMHLDGEGEPLPHFGRFTTLERPRKVQHTWMSLHTRGLESVVTLTFEAQGDGTLLTLHHAGLPDDDLGRAHEAGWAHYLDGFLGGFEARQAGA